MVIDVSSSSKTSDGLSRIWITSKSVRATTAETRERPAAVASRVCGSAIAKIVVVGR
jgi:hypothetical protein